MHGHEKGMSKDLTREAACGTSVGCKIEAQRAFCCDTGSSLLSSKACTKLAHRDGRVLHPLPRPGQLDLSHSLLTAARQELDPPLLIQVDLANTDRGLLVVLLDEVTQNDHKRPGLRNLDSAYDVAANVFSWIDCTFMQIRPWPPGTTRQQLPGPSGEGEQQLQC